MSRYYKLSARLSDSLTTLTMGLFAFVSGIILLPIIAIFLTLCSILVPFALVVAVILNPDALQIDRPSKKKSSQG